MDFERPDCKIHNSSDVLLILPVLATAHRCWFWA